MKEFEEQAYTAINSLPLSYKTTSMEGITLIKDITHNKQLVQIEIDNLDKLEENWEDILDVIIATLRKDDDKISLEDLEAELRKEGKL